MTISLSPGGVGRHTTTERNPLGDASMAGRRGTVGYIEVVFANGSCCRACPSHSLFSCRSASHSGAEQLRTYAWLS